MRKLVSIIMAVLVLAAIVLAGCKSSSKDVTGEAVRTVETPVKCIDGDGGKDYYTKSNVTLGSTVLLDQCASRSDMINPHKNKIGDLIEYYCEDDKKYGVTAYTCPYLCKDGACINAVEERPITVLDEVEEKDDESLRPCTDSDGGKNYWKKGTLSGSSIDPKTATDECMIMAGKPVLIERYCYSDKNGAAINYDCSNDKKTCQDGACVVLPPVNEARTDLIVQAVLSDDAITTLPGCAFGGSGNYRPNVVGYVKISSGLKPAKPEFSGFIGRTMYDKCDLGDRSIRIEYYCDSNGYAHQARLRCKYGCKDDKCEMG